MKKYPYHPDQFDKTIGLSRSLLDCIQQNSAARSICIPVITDLLLRDKWISLTKNIEDLQIKTQKDPSTYDAALKTASNLLEQLRTHETTYKANHDLNAFTESCSNAISRAIPVLEAHHGVTRACISFLNTLFALVSSKPLFGTHDNPGFFTKKTDIQKKLADFEETLQQITTPKH